MKKPDFKGGGTTPTLLLNNSKESSMEPIIAWPESKCPACNYDLREATPKAVEQGKNTNGKLIWTDFCPGCGHGLVVGGRELPPPPLEELERMATAPIIAGKTEANPDPEKQLSQEPSPPPEYKPEAGAITPPGPGQYFCTRCAANHNDSSKIGKRHNKNREA